jgi:hypothetical protein
MEDMRGIMNYASKGGSIVLFMLRKLRARGWGRASALAVATASTALFAGGIGPAAAGETAASACRDFCMPVGLQQLDGMRAQGLDNPANGAIRLGVILWDETRRQREPSPNNGASGTALTASFSAVSVVSQHPR